MTTRTIVRIKGPQLDAEITIDGDVCTSATEPLAECLGKRRQWLRQWLKDHRYVAIVVNERADA